MPVFFRAAVMLFALVGLPAAWTYYGPLPASAQRVVDRFVEVAKDAIGWSHVVSKDTVEHDRIVAPRFDEVLPTPQNYVPLSHVSSAAPVALASATMPFSEPQPLSANPLGEKSPNLESGELATELEPHLAFLRSMGAAHYAMEPWGKDGKRFRFHCSICLGENGNCTRHFEAIDTDPVATVRQVVGEVSAMQNASLDAASRVTQWR